MSDRTDRITALLDDFHGRLPRAKGRGVKSEDERRRIAISIAEALCEQGMTWVDLASPELLAHAKISQFCDRCNGMWIAKDKPCARVRPNPRSDVNSKYICMRCFRRDYGMSLGILLDRLIAEYRVMIPPPGRSRATPHAERSDKAVAIAQLVGERPDVLVVLDRKDSRPYTMGKPDDCDGRLENGRRCLKRLHVGDTAEKLKVLPPNQADTVLV